MSDCETNTQTFEESSAPVHEEAVDADLPIFEPVYQKEMNTVSGSVTAFEEAVNSASAIVEPTDDKEMNKNSGSVDIADLEECARCVEQPDGNSRSGVTVDLTECCVIPTRTLYVLDNADVTSKMEIVRNPLDPCDRFYMKNMEVLEQKIETPRLCSPGNTTKVDEKYSELKAKKEIIYWKAINLLTSGLAGSVVIPIYSLYNVNAFLRLNGLDGKIGVGTVTHTFGYLTAVLEWQL